MKQLFCSIKIFTLLLFLLCSCTKRYLKGIAKENSSNLFHTEITTKDSITYNFKIENQTDTTVLYTKEFHSLGNNLEVYTPSGIKLHNYDFRSHDLYIKLKPGDQFTITVQMEEHLGISRRQDAKETGWYRILWKNERLNIEKGFSFFFDYEKYQKKLFGG